MRAALYARVSTEDQANEGFSLDAQVKRLEAYCRVRGWEVAGVYRDEGFSGRNTDRPEYKHMMADSDSWDTILVLKMDRIHRNSVNFALMMDDLRAKGKEFTSMQDKFDTTTAMGRFVMDIMQRIAQLESEQIGERVKVGMEYKARNGTGNLGSGHPYGYVYRNGRLEHHGRHSILPQQGRDPRQEGRQVEQAVRRQHPPQPPVRWVPGLGRHHTQGRPAANRRVGSVRIYKRTSHRHQGLMPDNPKRAALYVRVSTDEQAAEGYSLDAQKNILEDHCLAEGLDVASIYEDDGYSGRNTNRPAYRRMMDEIDSWDVLVVLKMDRIHRNSRNFMSMMDELERNKKEFVSCYEALDTSNALGRFVVDMIQRMAQLESEQIGERTKMGMREKAENLGTEKSEKATMGFTPPFGYRIVDGSLMADENELPVVRDMFSSYLSGDTMDTICYSLNSSGTLTRRGNPWNKYNLRNVLHNPVYAGYMRWEELLIPHHAEKAVTPEDFNRVQELMASKVRDPAKRNVRLLPTMDDF